MIQFIRPAASKKVDEIRPAGEREDDEDDEDAYGALTEAQGAGGE